MDSPRHPGLQPFMTLRSGSALVVATIIGTGIFASTGFQVASIGHPSLIYMLWIGGGILSFFGALCYAELGAMMPRAGGEYVYLKETYGGVFGFITAFVSLTAGFSAPIAVNCRIFVTYLSAFVPALAPDPESGSTLPATLAALALLWVLVGIHLSGVRRGTWVNDLMTLVKAGGIALIVLAAAIVGRGDASAIFRPAALFDGLTWGDRMTGMATSLVFVMYAYTGWNAAAYMASEFRNPQRDLPRALLFGTALVAVLYLAINVVYFYGAGADRLAGEADVALIAAGPLFGPVGVTLVTALILVSVVSGASAIIMQGPRVYYAVGRDLPALGFLTRVHGASGVPVPALLLQAAVSSIFILVGTLEQVIVYAGYLLSISTMMAVAAVLVLRRRRPGAERPFRAWGYPLTPILFLSVSGWMVVFVFLDKPKESIYALLTIPAAAGLYALLRALRPG